MLQGRNDIMKHGQGKNAPFLHDESGFQFRDLNKNGKLDIYEDPRQPVEKRVEDLLSQMTMEEKVGLMFSPMIGQVDPNNLNKKPPSPKAVSVREALAVRHINTFGCIGKAIPEKFASWHNECQKAAECTRLGIPITLCSDPRHTYTQSNNPLANLSDSSVSSWPVPLGLAAARNPQLVEDFGRIAKQELCALGIRFAIHPVADTATEPRWMRILETFGEDAELNGTLVAAYIRGFQGERLDACSIACCAKHFPGGGPQKDGEDPHFPYGKDQVYPGNMFRYHLKPFEQAIAAGVAAVMPYYGRPIGVDGIEEIGFNFNRSVIQGLLRDKLGYAGLVYSDYNIIEDFKIFGIKLMPARAWGLEDNTPQERLEKAINAGVDQLGGESCTHLLIDLVRKGRITEDRLDDSCRRILGLKFQLGLFDNPYVNVEETIAICGKPEFQTAGDEAMRRSLVLLKKEKDGKQFLPLSGKPKVYTEGFDLKTVEQFAEPVKDIRKADFALIRLGTPYRLDLRELFALLFKGGDLDYTKKQKKHIKGIMESCPTIVSVKLLRPAVIPEIAERAAGIIGEFEVKDSILLEAIWGKFSPSGKLPFELPCSMDAVKMQKSDVPYDSQQPLYPFGFGLSY
jgi:beta-glucosidase